MSFYSLKDKNEQYSFAQAVRIAIGKNSGLLFPQKIPYFTSEMITKLLKMDFITRSSVILHSIIGDEVSENKLQQWIKSSFTFPTPLEKLDEKTYILELFKGPTLAFKDFGARFMAQALSWAMKNEDQELTILTATSGDTGAAVANAFYEIAGIKVVILYPKNMVTPLQQRMFTTLGKNIYPIEISGDFDATQALVKNMFSDQEVTNKIILNSANSINVSRLLAQCSYYFEAMAQQLGTSKNTSFCVPSGNFGNLCAGLLSKKMGLPIKRFIAATNINDTIPRYLKSHKWKVNKTIPTLSNAMDISQPSNWVRIEQGIYNNNFNIIKNDIVANYATDTQIKQMIKLVYDKYNYIIDPHTANGLVVANKESLKDEKIITLSTAHPSKFKETVEQTLDIKLELPPELSSIMNKKTHEISMSCDYNRLKDFLLS